MNSQTDLPTSAAQTERASGGVRQVLTAIVSELCEVEPALIGEEFVLASSGRLRSSLGRATLDAKIRRRLGVKIENLHTLRTFGELEAALAGNYSGAAVAAPPVPRPTAAEMPQPLPLLQSLAGAAPTFPSAQRSSSLEAPSTALSGSQVASSAEVLGAESGLACGIDVESISALPEAKDYWEEPFYKANFTSVEIAYCVSQSNPRMHFAARWCAKEALKKCLPVCVQCDMNRIEVVRGEAGRPSLRVIADDGARTPPVALSLTHSDDWALAMVVTVAEMPPPSHAAPSDAATGSRMGLVLSLAALICSMLALILALNHR
jgi:holo-[acyl-carrier protein] synthase